MSARKKRLVELVVEKVEELCENVELALELGLPSRLSNYLTYTELVLLRLTSRAMTWSVNESSDCAVQGQGGLQFQSTVVGLQAEKFPRQERQRVED